VLGFLLPRPTPGTILPLDDLLIEAKILAAAKKTTLRAIVESALRREIRPPSERKNPVPEKYEIGPFGILSLKRDGRRLTAGEVRKLMDHQRDAGDEEALNLARGRK
jgi:hypothetical protein